MSTDPLGKTKIKHQVRKGRKKGCLGFIISTHDIGKMGESRQVTSQMIPSSTAVKGQKKENDISEERWTEDFIFQHFISSQCHTMSEMYHNKEELSVKCAKKILSLLF